MAKGDSKSNPIDGAKIEGSTASKPVSGLNITRDGNTFTAHWKNEATYSEIRFKYSLCVGGSWGSFTSKSTSKTATSQTFTVNLANYSTLSAVQCIVATDQATITKYNVYKKKGKWYRDTDITRFTLSLTPAIYNIRFPLKPSVSVTGGASSTTYNYSVGGTDSKLETVFNYVEYNTASVANWGSKNPAQCTSWSGATRLYTDSGEITQSGRGASYVSGTSSVTAMLRIKSVGPNGSETTPYSYQKIVYAYPANAVNVRATASTQSTGYNCVARWDTKEDDLHPVNENKVEWYIGPPANANLDCPPSVTWESGTDYTPKRKDDGIHQSAQFYINRQCTDEDCLWVRVWQRNLLTNETAGNAVRVTGTNSPSAITPVAPTISDIDYDASTNSLSVELSSATTLPAAGMTYTTKFYSGNTCKATFTGLTPNAQTVDLGSGTIRVVAQAKFGGYQSAQTVRNYEPTLEADNPAEYAPTNVVATPGTAAGSARVTWTNTMKTITKATVAISTDPLDWSDATEVDFTGNVREGTVTNLLYGVPYYFKVQTTRNGGSESDLSSSTGSVTLSAASVTPAITLQEDSNTHNVVVRWNWNGWAQAKKIEIMWSDNQSAGGTNSNIDATSEEVERGLKSGADSYIISGLERGRMWYVWARFGADAAWTNRSYNYIMLAVTPVAPTVLAVRRSPQTTDEEGETTVSVGWSNMWTDSEDIEISWSDNKNAWSSSTAPSTMTIDETRHGYPIESLITGLELGKTWYFKVKAIYDKWSAETQIYSLDLRTKPETPLLSVSSNDVYIHGHIDLSWNYYCEDLSEQGSATVTVTNSNNAEVARLTTGSDHSIALYPDQYDLDADATYTMRVRTVSANGIVSEQSSAVTIHVTGLPEAEIYSTSLATDNILDELPLEVEVHGAEDGGEVIVYIERSKAMFLERPDETKHHGYEGELIAVKQADYDGTVSFGMEDLRTAFDDGGEYRIVAKISNEYGTSDPAIVEFTCQWEHQALVPEGTLETDYDNNIAIITPVAPTGIGEDDVCDIYRLSADRPELIVQGAEWGTEYVDPYPALGPTYGYRLVTRTAEGDYTTDEGVLAWLDIDGSVEDITEEPVGYLYGDKAIIDFDNDQVEVKWNLDVSHGWSKDFTETQYLGGAVQGDWNAAVSRTASLGTVMLSIDDEETIRKLRRLAVWTGICHVRTPDGSSFPADVQVSETRSYESAGEITEFGLEVTRVDSEGFDGMTLAEYEGES